MFHRCNDKPGAGQSHRLADTYAQSRAVLNQVEAAAAQAKDILVPLAQDARERLVPLAQDARERLVPLAQDARERLVPLAQDARERLVPLAHDARERLIPLAESASAKVAELRGQAVPVLLDAGQRSRRAVAAFRSDLIDDAPVAAPPAKHHHPILKTFALGAIAAMLALLIRALLDSRDSHWKASALLEDEPTQDLGDIDRVGDGSAGSSSAEDLPQARDLIGDALQDATASEAGDGVGETGDGDAPGEVIEETFEGVANEDATQGGEAAAEEIEGVFDESAAVDSDAAGGEVIEETFEEGIPSEVDAGDGEVIEETFEESIPSEDDTAEDVPIEDATREDDTTEYVFEETFEGVANQSEEPENAVWAEILAVTQPEDAPPESSGDPFRYGEGSYVGAVPPAGYEIKANERSMKYHLPGAIGYRRCQTDLWFNSPEAAERAGFTRSLR